MGEWKADQKIPSVRDLAIRYSVNPNTVQRALTELELQGLLRSERTLGRFVQGNISSLKKIKTNELDDLTRSFLKKMINMGQTKEEVIETIDKLWGQL